MIVSRAGPAFAMTRAGPAFAMTRAGPAIRVPSAIMTVKTEPVRSSGSKAGPPAAPGEGGRSPPAQPGPNPGKLVGASGAPYRPAAAR